MKMLLSLLCFSLILFVQCSSIKKPEKPLVQKAKMLTDESRISDEPDVSTIKTLLNEWVQLYNVEDFDSLMSAFYTGDAILMSPNAYSYRGKEAILIAYQKDSILNNEHVDNEIVEDVRVSGDLAVARGTDTGITTPKHGGKLFKYNCKWLIVFARQSDSTWKCIDEMWNDNPFSKTSEKGQKD